MSYGMTASDVRRAEILTRKRAVMDAVPEADQGRGKVGKLQMRLIACLFDHGHYSPGCGWVWGTDSQTQSILTSLVNRGLASVKWNAVRSVSTHGRLYSRPTYTLCEDLERIAYPNDSRWATTGSTTTDTKAVV